MHGPIYIRWLYPLKKGVWWPAEAKAAQNLQAGLVAMKNRKFD